MNKDQVIGVALMAGSIAVVLVVAWLLFFAPEEISLLTLKVIVTLAIAAMAGVVGWIGYTLSTTPPPKPIEEIEREIEEELRKLQGRVSGEEGGKEGSARS